MKILEQYYVQQLLKQFNIDMRRYIRQIGRGGVLGKISWQTCKISMRIAIASCRSFSPYRHGRAGFEQGGIVSQFAAIEACGRTIRVVRWGYTLAGGVVVV